jgi:hypothetical protein
MTDLLALDIATRCGWARGPVGDPHPQSGSVRFGTDGASNNAVFAHCLAWISETLKDEPRPDIVVVEAMLPPTAKVGKTTRETRDRLAGLHGIVRAVSFLRGIYDVREASVSQVRHHFIGGNFKSETAERETRERCRRLGWNPEDHNAADALALWAFEASTLDPQFGITLSPLFHGRTGRVIA